ncbi:phage protein NinX family protein [Providencia sp. PROV066]|uniref:phage protein NinX family protein n=1 Tax=Providencia sp. PROV066 TaxID=2949792 RepID=UPI00234B7E33|nr:phage protein NinX family protein [Providencia sp. PROV066]
MNKYTKLSDFEINKKVAEKLLIPHYVIKDKVLNAGNDSVYDPCNNPADAMPIIIENGIAIRPYKTATPVAFNAEIGEFYGHTIYNENVLRAAMELFLLIKDTENENNNNS